jgi:hypothetical protein
MLGAKRRKPNPHHRSSAINKARQQIITEIAGTILAAAIFAASVLTSAFGMAGGFDHQEAGLMLAGVVSDAR